MSKLKYYFVSYYFMPTRIHNIVLDYHPIDWKGMKDGGVILFYNEITKRDYDSFNASGINN